MYRRSLLVGVVVGLPLSFVFLYLAVRGLHPSDLADTLSRANPLKVALGVALMGVIYSVQAARWRWIARSAGALGWRTFLRLVICSLAVNNVIPGRPGELLRGYWLGRAARIPQSRAFSTVVVDRSSDVLFLVAAFAATFPFVKHPAWLRHVFVAAIVLGCLIAAALAVAGLHAGGSRLAARMLSFRLRRSWAGRQLAGLVHGAGALVNRRDALVLVLLTSVVWSCWALAAWLVASALGISLSPVELVFLTTVINLGAAIPSSPGFVGTFQWLCVSGMALFGVGQADALAFSIIMQAIWYVPTSLVGLILLTHSGLSVWSSDGVADISSPI
jgi:glycosyltransferase 2 family protein